MQHITQDRHLLARISLSDLESVSASACLRRMFVRTVTCIYDRAFADLANLVRDAG